MEESAAVFVKDVVKTYGSNPVLKNFNMYIQRGTIYGLLGASGCGKTTLLSSFVGSRKINSGQMWVLGVPQNGRTVLGPRVGFMPQGLGLVQWLTVKDTIFYFGRIMNMPDKLISERHDFMCEVMDLPPSDKYIKDCSGGEQRRISFATSVIHMPELLILDEPTVGMDPLLREKIWEFLCQMTKEKNMTVILTTHYIEEARQADMIGIMRHGRLLAEDAPPLLLEKFQMEHLEDVFLTLSQKQEAGNLEPIQYSSRQISNTPVNYIPQEDKIHKSHSEYSVNKKRMKALMDKNWKQFYRNYLQTAFLLCFPFCTAVMFLSAIGRDVTDIKVAIVNDESIDCKYFEFNSSTMLDVNTDICYMYNMSCRFLQYLEDPMIYMIEYNSLDQAKDDIRRGKVTGALHISRNFSEAFQERQNATLSNSSVIEVWLDMSNQQIGESVKYRIFQRYVDFHKDLSEECEFESDDVMQIKHYYGNEADNFTDFMVPGMILTIMFLVCIILSAVAILTERTEGIWDRALIAGVSSLEIMLSFFVMDAVIAILYTAEILFVIFYWFQVAYVGNMWMIAIMAYTQGLVGLSFGLWISVVSKDFFTALVISTGLFYFIILTSGLIWPYQAMPIYLQWLAKFLPFALPIDSLRDVVKKGWMLDNLNVTTGFMIEVTWMTAFLVVTTITIKMKR